MPTCVHFHMPSLNAMQASSSIVNPSHAVSLGANAELQSHCAISLHITTLRKHRVSFLRPVNAPTNGTISMLHAPMCKGKDIKELSSNDVLTSPSSPPSPTVKLAPHFLLKQLSILGSEFSTSQREGSLGCGKQYDGNFMWMIHENWIAMRLRLNDTQRSVLDTLKRRCTRRLKSGRMGLVVFIAAIICLTSPTVMVTTDASIFISSNVAFAQPGSQIRQAALLLERLGGSTPAKVLDKVVTVISGQTVVTPETVEQLKSIIEGEKDPSDWQANLANSADTLWSTTVDLVSNFDPISLVEATGNGIQGLFEAGAERFAAFELSTLVALGERWVLWTPFVILPMYWQMTRNRDNEENVGSSGEKLQAVAVELSEEAVAKAARVRDELERIELKASLLDLVYSLGKSAWQTSGDDQNMKRKQIDEILARLQDLNPTSSSVLGSALVKGNSPEFPVTQPVLDVDGEWNLIYVSQTSAQTEQTQFPPLFSLNIPGVELSNMRQKLWRVGLKSALLVSESEAELLVARNTAQVRLGPLGVVEVSVQGSWQNRSNGNSAVVSFNTFSAKPVEVLGTRVREDLPPLDLAIPSTLQTSGEWKTVYLDNSLRINRGRTGQFFLFRKSQ